MQLFGLNCEGKIIVAANACLGVNYFCPECQGILRARKGPQKRAHFFHLTSPSNCFLKGKSLRHLQTQLFIQDILPDTFLEHCFPSINRIADVAHHQNKIIFEVQCSPISLDEVISRNRDYGSLGYQVIWILHDIRYNRRRMSAAEAYLRRNGGAYFTNMDEIGRGWVYDQSERCSYYRRIIKGKPFPANLLAPLTQKPTLQKQDKKFLLRNLLRYFIKNLR